MKAYDLKTEYLRNPLGIDILSPRFSWKCDGLLKQSAYQIVCKRDGEVIYDSGKVLSDQTTQIPYEGRFLRSRDYVDVSLTIWDEKGKKSKETKGFFEMGLLEKTDWYGRWITGDYKPEYDTRYPLDCFRKTFSLKEGFTKARLYITACGIYAVSFNGKDLGTRFMPGVMDFRKRTRYQTYDVTGLLEKENEWKIELGDGYYRGALGAFGCTAVYGRETKVLAQLEVYYPDGTRTLIGTDPSFDWSNDGPVRFNDVKDGEIYMADLTPSYKGKAKVVKYDVVPVSSNSLYVHKHETFKGKKINDHVYDFSQNLAGIITVRAKGQKGDVLKIVLGECVKDGHVDLSQVQCKRPVKEMNKLTQSLVACYLISPKGDEWTVTPKQEVLLHLSGNEDVYEMKYSVAGFRYAEVSGKGEILEISASAVYSDLEELSSFTCDNADIVKLYENTIWSMKGNYLDIPTDCPTRERMGWTGDGQVFFRTASYLMDIPAFYRKWLDDFKDGQLKNGQLPSVVPYCGADMMYVTSGSSVGWNDAGILIPYRFYQVFGDKRILEENYDMMNRIARFMVKNAGPKNKKELREHPEFKYVYEKGTHLGEWLEPEEFQDKIGEGKVKVISTKREEATAYMHYTLNIMADIAALLGKKDDEALFREYSNGAKEAYNICFLKEIPDTDRQAKLVRPLALGLADGDTKKKLEDRLVKAVHNKDYCVMTGFLSTPFVLDTLVEAGRPDLAYGMLENTKSPGWLYEVSQGATTIWESWEGNASLNHYSPGAVVSFLFERMAGISVERDNLIKIAPLADESIKEFDLSYDSIYGVIRVALKDGHYEVTVPANTVAEITIGSHTDTYPAGTHVL